MTMSTSWQFLKMDNMGAGMIMINSLKKKSMEKYKLITLSLYMMFG